MGNAAKMRRRNGSAASANASCCADPSHPQVGDQVAIIRHEHGWHDGDLGGVVTSIHHHHDGRGVAYGVMTEDGYPVFCRSRGDVRKTAF